MSSGTFSPLQGMVDLCAPEVHLWQRVEEAARRLFPLYGFEEVRTPILERTSVFTRSLGETTDVVQKEMYAFEDRGGRSVALRPEGTAGVIRYVGGAGPEAAESRLYYIGPMFRAERPQAGRRRQFHQIGVESLGAPHPLADAECLALQVHLLDAIGLEGADVQVSTRGAPEDAAAVAAGLRGQLEPRRGELCEDCRRRIDANVLRALDCKQDACRAIVAGLPPVTTFMSEATRTYFDRFRSALDRLGVRARPNPLIVRGLDYYVHSIWEITHGALGAQDALSGGGRYRVQMDGRTVDGVGFAMGIERLVMALQKAGAAAGSPYGGLRVWIVSAGDDARAENLALAQDLRRRGIACGMDLAGRSMKAQMRAAARAGVEWTVIRGDDELARGIVQLRHMRTSDQDAVDLSALLERLNSRPG